MKFNYPFITLFLTILLLISSFCFFLFITGRSILSYENVYDVTTNLDIIKCLKEDEKIKESFDEKKIPIEVFDYIDRNSLNNLISESLDNLYLGNKNILNDSKLKNIIFNSIKIYENKHTVDIYKYIEKDIDIFVSNISNTINSDEFSSNFYGVNSIVNDDFYLYCGVGISLLLILSIVFLEKKNSMIVIGIIFVIMSLLLYLISLHFNWELIFKIVNLDIYKYFINPDITFIDGMFDPIYVLLFILGFILITIYIFIYIKFLLKKVRSMYYNSI